MKLNISRIAMMLVCAGTLLNAGCLGMPTNLTERFRRNPQSMQRYPRLGSLCLGGKYVVVKDMLLIGSPARNRYRLTYFDFAGHPKTPEEYLANKGKWEVLEGIIYAGTIVRGDRVEKWRQLMVTSWGGTVYRIETGQHAGKLLSPEPMMLSYGENSTLIINPEVLREISPPYLDARGQPLGQEREEARWVAGYLVED